MVRLLNRCRLSKTEHRPDGSGKEQKHEWIAFAASSKGESVPCVLISVLTSRMDQFIGQPSAQVCYGLVCSPQPPPLLSFPVLDVLQSEVLRLVLPLEGSPVHVSHFFCTGE